jgi:hypothetical protein
MRTASLALTALLLGAAPGIAQKDKDTPKWRIDPYTKNEPKALEAAGYVSYGPFLFGNVADKPTQSTDVDARLEYAPILWVETKHFRIGSNLPKFTVPQDMETRTKIRTELERLQKRIPSVNPKTRELDPWLRLHLTAQRAEELYAEVQELWGVTDADFPADPSKVVRMPGARYMGFGPYLGMKEKYQVLMFEKLDPYRAYLKDFLGKDSKFPQRWHFKETGCILFAFSTECDGGNLKHDTAIHCALAFNVGQNLLDGFRSYTYDLPVWIKEGWSHWLLRRIDGKWNQFDQQEGSAADMKKVSDWAPYVRNLVSTNGKFAPFSEAYTWRDFGAITFNDHTAIWSRMDFLIAQGKDKFQKFLFAVKGRVDDQWYPDQSDLVGATRDALRDAYGISVLDFDRKWGEWVKANYPSK